MTPTPFWPTPTPLPPMTPVHPINMNFEIGQDMAYGAVQFWQTANQSGGIEFVQVGVIVLIVMWGLWAILGSIRDL